MKFSIKNAELSGKLALVARTIATGGGTPALGGILVTSEEGRLSFSSTNGNLSLRVPVHVEGVIEGDGKVLLPGRLFSDISRLLGSGQVGFEYRQAERDVAIRSGSSNFHIRTLAGDDFPPLPEPGEQTISLSRDSLLSTIDLVARAASRDDMRPVLTSVQVLASGNEMTMVATDSYRLAVKQTTLREPVSVELDKNIPAQALKELSRLLSSSEDESIKLTVTDRVVIFVVDGAVLSTTTVDGQFPKYQQLFPETYEHDIRLPRTELLESVKRVSQMAQKNRPLKVTLTPGEITISADTPDLGDAEEKLPANFEGEELSIGFNHEFFRDGIEAISGDEVLLRLISPLRPGLLQPVDGDDYRYLVMPIRLNE
ncbi:MAG TPA: DNA polymerase III subunit beta [Solirubrobacterales bacterium]|nr:DNA polymerase III subunit beta [Solirubrobacterales bacterium]